MNTVQSYWEQMEEILNAAKVGEEFMYPLKYSFYCGFSGMMDMSKKLAREIVHDGLSHQAAAHIMKGLEIELEAFIEADEGRIRGLHDTRTDSPAR